MLWRANQKVFLLALVFPTELTNIRIPLKKKSQRLRVQKILQYQIIIKNKKAFLKDFLVFLLRRKKRIENDLKEKEITQKEERCPFCGSKNRKAKLTIQNTPEVHLLKCNDCHACSASKMPTQATLEKYYSSYYDSNEEGITFSRKEVFGKHLCMYSKSSLKGNILILDYWKNPNYYNIHHL